MESIETAGKKYDCRPGFPVVLLKLRSTLFQGVFEDVCVRRCTVMYADVFVHKPECTSAPKSVLNGYIAAG